MANKRNPTLILFAGPSGGHLFPALGFTECWKSRFPDSLCYLVTGKRGELFMKSQGASVYDGVFYINDFPLPHARNFAWFVFLYRFMRAMLQTVSVWARIRPKIMVGFGSYVIFPGVIMSKITGTPVLLHEQNMIPGKATSMMARWADRIALSFPNSNWCKDSNKICLTGMPLRSRLLKVEKQVVPDLPLKILVLGGSQGADEINQLFISALNLMTPEEIKKIAVIHIAGEPHMKSVKDIYRQMKVSADVYGFCAEMEKIFSQAHLVVSRAGSSTLFEMAHFQIPAFLIPYRFASNHQRANAEAFARQGGALVAAANTEAAWLTGQLKNIMEQPNRLSEMRKAVVSFNTPNAGNNLVQEAAALLGEKTP